MYSDTSDLCQKDTNSEVELKVLLPDKTICVVTVHRSDNADSVYKVCLLNNETVISILLYQQ